MLPEFSLRARNSFGFEVLAEQAYSITDAEQIGVVMAGIEAAGLPWRVRRCGIGWCRRQLA
jgi:hypothetical protein